MNSDFFKNLSEFLKQHPFSALLVLMVVAWFLFEFLGTDRYRIVYHDVVYRIDTMTGQTDRLVRIAESGSRDYESKYRWVRVGNGKAKAQSVR